jgi:hypothetical protein
MSQHHPEDDSDDPPLDFDELEDDLGVPSKPPPPLPLSPDTVTQLTHNKLLVNQEFVKYINIVNMLLHLNASANCEFFFFFSLFPCSLVDTHSLCTIPAFNFASSKLLSIHLAWHISTSSLSQACVPSL